MPAVRELDPSAVPIGDIFAAGMEGPSRPREVPSPADIDPDAPHGRDGDGRPLAPFGLTKDGKPKRTAAGRKPADDARVVKPGTPGDPDLGRPKLEERDYTRQLAETSEAVWVGLSMVSMVPLDQLPVIRSIPVPAGKGRPRRRLGELLKGAEVRVAAQAHIFNANRGALVGALNMAANNSVKARRLVERMETGDATWVLMCGAMILPLMSQSLSLWGSTLADDGLPPAADLAGRNKATMDAWIAAFNARLEQAAADAETQAGLNGQAPA